MPEVSTRNKGATMIERVFSIDHEDVMDLAEACLRNFLPEPCFPEEVLFDLFLAFSHAKRGGEIWVPEGFMTSEIATRPDV